MDNREKIINDLYDFVADLSPFVGSHADWTKVNNAIEYLQKQKSVEPLMKQVALPLGPTNMRVLKKYYCSACRQEITGNNVYCHRCGRKVNWDASN